MAAKGKYLVTLADVAKSANKSIGKVAEVLMQTNSLAADMIYMEMNEGTIHKEDIRTALPSVYYRKANQPIPSGKSTTEERSFTAAHFESKSTMDEAVAKRGGEDRIAYNRWNQAQGHIQAQANELASLMIYGSPASSNRKVAGLADIYSTLATTEETSKQIVDAGGVQSDNTSIYRIQIGERSIFSVFPKGTQAGLQRIDRSANGKVQIYGTDENGNAGTFYGYQEDFMTDHGLVVKDFRQAARIANIDVSNLKANAGADLLDLMISAHYLINDPNEGQGYWYVNRTIEAMLHKQARKEVGASAGLSFETVAGKPVLMYLGCPVRRMDAILNSEEAVTA